MDFKQIELRPARLDDFEFRCRLHEQTLRTYVEQTWGVWDDADQLERLRKTFFPVRGDIIVFSGVDIGYMSVRDDGTGLFLELIAILPMYQGRGIGTKLVKRVLERADQKHVPVRLNVLKVNPARSLYERLGFQVVGGDEHRHFMERSLSTPLFHFQNRDFKL